MSWAGVAGAEDVKLKGVEVSGEKACHETLAEFNNVCAAMDLAQYYRQGWIIFYRHDIDGDGKDDAILTFYEIGGCPRGGELCHHAILFGGEPVPEMVRYFDHTFYGYPVISNRNGQPMLYFDRSPDRPLSMQQIREETAAGPVFRP